MIRNEWTKLIKNKKGSNLIDFLQDLHERVDELEDKVKDLEEINEQK